MHDLLTIRDLELWTRIGVPALERETEQRLLVTVEMTMDARASAKTDDVAKSVNYADVAAALKTLALTERKTIERFAEDAAAMIVGAFQTLSVRLTVTKFALPGTAGVSLTIERGVK